jgi:hypothetical protein
VKIWIGYGSEHSSRLVMIGRFVDETAAALAKQKFDKLTEHVAEQTNAGTLDLAWDSSGQMNESLLDALSELHLYSLAASDVANFAYDFETELQDDTITLRTDETEVQGFLKVMIYGGARIEVYSRDDWTDAGEPRQREE